MTCKHCARICTRVRDFCIQCSSCSNCCFCDFIGFISNKHKFHTAKQTEKAINKSDRFIAAELEIAGIKKPFINANVRPLVQTINKWSCSTVQDGSLPLCGFEITTSPANGDKFIKQIKEITTHLNNLDAMITDDCGFHLHIDARDYNFYDIAKLIKVYAVIEPIFFGMVPVKRTKSKYCLPCGDVYKKALESNGSNYLGTKLQVIQNTYKDYNSNESRKTKYNNARYNALNLHSWFYRGTIEFRLMPGTIDANMITMWGILWANILDWVLKASNEDVDELVKLKGGIVFRKLTEDKDLMWFVNTLLDRYAPVKKKSKPKTKKKAKRS